MKEPEFTKMSSKGQVVIPLGIRKELELKEGTPLAVVAKDNAILLKKVEMPAVRNWEEATRPFKGASRRSHFTQEDLEKLIADARKK
ncbi:MAG: AbrB/MazE/SpoVT family DNA-binding domain-containing protein [Candidatus Aenigmarchaeota archaeon]|nr:AbrB/MazE/SpoVT family DNA-binding domain-containing protein [Candidatus Aenigmarchaeota archaeon]